MSDRDRAYAVISTLSRNPDTVKDATILWLMVQLDSCLDRLNKVEVALHPSKR